MSRSSTRARNTGTYLVCARTRSYAYALIVIMTVYVQADGF
jgi:hypothetical protein